MPTFVFRKCKIVFTDANIYEITFLLYNLTKGKTLTPPFLLLFILCIFAHCGLIFY